MSTKDLHPGLGSGALREALRVAHLYILRNDRWSEPVLCRACLKSAILAKDIPHAEGCLYVRIEALLSLSSPIEPEIRLGVHLQHCNFGEYPNACKYGDDDCPALTESWSWFGKALERARPTSQASSEIRERLAAIPGDVDTLLSRMIYGETVEEIRRKVAGYLERALAPSRQGVGGK